MTYIHQKKIYIVNTKNVINIFIFYLSTFNLTVEFCFYAAKEKNETSRVANNVNGYHKGKSTSKNNTRIYL